MGPAVNETPGLLSRVWARVTSPQPVSSWAIPVGGGRIPGVRLSDWRQALQVPAVWRAINLISGSIAMLPWNVNKRDADGKITAQEANPIHWMLHDAPNDEIGAFVFRQTIVGHALGQGNGYAEIERNKRGTPVNLWLIDDPDRVTPGRSRSTGKIIYEVRQAGGGTVYLDAKDMFHIHGLASDGINGLGILEVARRSIAVNIALDKVAEKYFTQGMRTPGFLKMKSGASGFESLKEMMKIIRDEFVGLQNFEMPIPIDKDMDFQPAGSNLHDAEFINLRKFGVLDIARWFGVPPHLLYDLDKATFSNIESQDRTFLKYGLLPRIKPFEEEANRKLLSNRFGGLYSQMDVSAFEQGDSAAFIAFAKGMSDIGAWSPNDVLRKLGESTIGPEGDQRTKQAQYKPIGDQGPATPPASAPGADEDDETSPAASARRVNGAGH